MIRKAEVKDRKEAAALYHTAGPHICDYCFAGDASRSRELIELLCDRPGVMFSLENCRVFVEDGKVCGAVFAYSGSSKKEYDRNISRYGKEILKLTGPLSVLRMMVRGIRLGRFVPAVGNDEYYIETLAVFPDYRGRKIASALLRHAFDSAREQGFSKVSLLVETHNTHALEVYKKTGFAVTATRMLPRWFGKHGMTGFHKMEIRV